MLFWLLGLLALARWSDVPAAVLVVAATIVVLVAWGRRLDALAIGDETTRALGTDPGRFRIQLFVVVSVCVGAVVAVSGTIAFVGLVVPHFARRLVGGEHRLVVPVSALIGATFLVWADVFARVTFQPGEIPIGIVTAIIGTPLLLVLVCRFRSALN
ncbi:MAG: FecCD family ABC transporter permease [Pseudonocardiaceae bacterium]